MSILYNNLRIFTPSEQSGPLIPCNSEMVDSSDNSMFFWFKIAYVEFIGNQGEKSG